MLNPYRGTKRRPAGPPHLFGQSYYATSDLLLPKKNYGTKQRRVSPRNRLLAAPSRPSYAVLYRPSCHVVGAFCRTMPLAWSCCSRLRAPWHPPFVPHVQCTSWLAALTPAETGGRLLHSSLVCEVCPLLTAAEQGSILVLLHLIIWYDMTMLFLFSSSISFFCIFFLGSGFFLLIFSMAQMHFVHSDPHLWIGQT